MRTKIDAAGRVVIPKALRDALGLDGGSEVDISLVDGRIEIDVPPIDVRLERRGNMLVAVSNQPVPVLTTEMVREVLEQTRR